MVAHSCIVLNSHIEGNCNFRKSISKIKVISEKELMDQVNNFPHNQPSKIPFRPQIPFIKSIYNVK